MKNFKNILSETNTLLNYSNLKEDNQAFLLGKLKGEVETLENMLTALDIKSKYDKNPITTLEKQFKIVYNIIKEL